MNIDKIEQNYLDKLMLLDKPEVFGVSFVQRSLVIGYNMASYVADLGVQKGLLERDEKTPYKYKAKSI